MSIVLRENEWAENMIKNKSLGKKPSETFRRVARYYLDKGYNKRDVRNLLDIFLMRCDSSLSLAKWSDAMDHAVSRAQKYKAINIDGVDITKPEMEIIDSLEGKQIKRLAFTLLCLSKYWMSVIPDGDYWVNNRDNEIMATANINTSIKRQSMMYWTLHELGLIQFSRKVDSTNVRVCFAKNGDIAMRVTDFRNLGYQYLRFHGEPYFECESCGLTTKISAPNKGCKQRYCRDCAVAIHTKQMVNSVMKRRSSKM